ncbi:CHAP domain-containing protein [Lactococcus kimchii]|nr:CHAP domain-containing protein [Lactococcus sp. S-13]
MKKGGATLLIILFCAGITKAVDADVVNIYRLYNKVSMEHLYTASENEYTKLPYISNDWVREGVNFRAQNKPTNDTNPIYRVYNRQSGEHIYTSDNNEVRVLTTKYSWKNEGIAFYSQKQSTKPVYRVYNAAAGIGSHFVTMSSYEKDSLVSRGWKYEGIAWYAFVDPIPNVPAGWNISAPRNIDRYVTTTYSFKDCTWWVYNRAKDFGINYGAYMGNGQDWANQPGYQVYTSPRLHSAVSFKAGASVGGVWNTSSVAGHVAFVEAIRPDGSILLSQSGAGFSTVFNYQVLTKAQAEGLKYVVGK